MIRNSLGVSFEVLCLSVMQPSFGFTNAKAFPIPATGFVDNLISASGSNDLCKERKT